MKGYRFYADAGENRSKSASKKHCAWTVKNLRDMAERGVKANCLALDVDTREALAATFYHDDSDVSVTGVSREYLDKHCTRVPEDLARKLHPRLFAALDA